MQNNVTYLYAEDTEAQPKKQPKTKQQIKQKTQPKPISLTSQKILLDNTYSVHGCFRFSLRVHDECFCSGNRNHAASVVVVISFAGYIKFKPSTMKATIRATFIFAGASIIGFLIWVATILLTSAVGVEPQIAKSIGNGFFAITSLIICLISGGFIGELIGKNKEKLQLSIHKTKNKLFKLSETLG